MLAKRIMSGVLGVAMLSTLALSGCQSSEKKQHAAGVASPGAVMCDKCKTTWVSTPQQHGKVTTYSSSKVMTCPDCKSSAANFFRTGKLEHACKSCGGQVQHCEVHE